MKIFVLILCCASFSVLAEGVKAEKPPAPPEDAPWASDPNKDKLEVAPEEPARIAPAAPVKPKITNEQKAVAASVGLFGIGLFILGLVFYFLPTLIANSNKHHNVLSIFLVNFFFGWSIFGWIAALIWAFSKPAPKS